MRLQQIRSKIHDALVFEEQHQYLAGRLAEDASSQGQRLDAAAIEQVVALIRAYVEQLPSDLETFIGAAREAAILDEIAPLLAAAERYFLSPPDGIPDEAGLAGLVDNAYMVYSLFFAVPNAEWPPETLELHQTIRGWIGEPLVARLDENVATLLASPDVQAALTRIASMFHPSEPGAQAEGIPGVPSGYESPVGVRSDVETGQGPFSLLTISRISVVSVTPAPLPSGRPSRDESTTEALDPTFGDRGLVQTVLQDGVVYALALQPDGNIVVAGEATDDAGRTSAVVARYRPDGRLDSAFGKTGCVRIECEEPSEIKAVALQHDGKILLAGAIGDLLTDVGVFRLNRDGSLDTGFGQGGAMRLHFSSSSRGRALAAQRDGRILIAGDADAGRGPLSVIRLTPDGRPDRGFGDAGVATIDGSIGDIADAVTVQEDGKILAAGSIGGFKSRFAIVRLTARGVRDSSFGRNGVMTVEAEGKAHALTLQADGKILAAGEWTGPIGQFVVLRSTADGTLDATFGNGGAAVAEFAGLGGVARAVVVLTDGTIVAAGTVTADVVDLSKVGVYGQAVEKFAFALAAFNPDGSPDLAFGTGGLLTTDFGGGNTSANAMLVQPDGKIVTAGTTGRGFALARYPAPGTSPRVVPSAPTQPSPQTREPEPSDHPVPGTQAETGSPLPAARPGGLDLTFGHAGVQVGVDAAEARAVALQPDGKIVVGGHIDAGPAHSLADFLVARFTSDGHLDPTFRGTGVTTVDFHGDNDKAYGLAIQGDGRIVVVGEAVNKDNYSVDFGLVRLHADGSLDRSFGLDGAVLTDFGEGRHDSGRAVALQYDGKIVVVGYTTVFKDGAVQEEQVAAARYDSEGRLDPGFGTGGMVKTGFAGGLDRGLALAIQEDGKIVVAGGSSAAGSPITDFGVIRYLPDGNLDPAFGQRGLVTTDFGQSEDIAQAVVIQSDGRILVGGYSAGQGGTTAVLARYNPDGTLDPTFGRGGRVNILFGGKHDAVSALAQLADGRIIVVGHAPTHAQAEMLVEDFAVACLNVDGRLDPSFGIDGIVMTDFGGLNDLAYAVAVQADEKIVVAGTSVGAAGARVALARYQTF